MKTQTQAELENWAQAFSLERRSLVGAFEKYGHLLSQLEGREVTDGELAMSLAQLRKNVGREVIVATVKEKVEEIMMIIPLTR